MGLYFFFKSMHIIFMVCWMAGLFYLPRLFVYHVKAKPGGELDETLKVMERKLLRMIINPSMILTFCFGLCLIHSLGKSVFALWFYIKIFFVLILASFHGLCAKWRKDFAMNNNKHTERFFRIVNEIPAVCLIAIVFLVIYKGYIS